jgi:hypothetical protein
MNEALIFFLFTLVIFGMAAAGIRRGKLYGYTALSFRTRELINNGVNVYLAYSNKSVGAGRRSMWDLLNTGYLIYFVNDELVIEFPWWKKMQGLSKYTRADDIKIRAVKRAYTKWRKMSGLYITDRSYVVCGINVQDIKEIRNLLKVTRLDTNTAEYNAAMLKNDLKNAGFVISD